MGSSGCWSIRRTERLLKAAPARRNSAHLVLHPSKNVDRSSGKREPKNRKENRVRMWRTPGKTQITDQVYLGCTQRECETNNIIVTEKSELLNQLVSSCTSTTTEFNYDTKRNVTSWSYDMQGHAPQCVERYCELGNRTTITLSTPCLDENQFKHENVETVGEPSQVCLQNVFMCIQLALSDRTFFGP